MKHSSILGGVLLLCVSCAPQAPAATAPVPAGLASAQGTAACALTSRYQPEAAPSSVPALPKPPELVQQPMRAGEAYTVWGASYLLRSALHRAEVTRAPIAITGYIVKTSLPEAPKCAVHAAAVADASSCMAPLPTFWLADRADATLSESITVVGFASSYGQLYDAIRSFDGKQPDAKYEDGVWGIQLPNPLPAAGAKVTVTGRYGMRFAKSKVGGSADSVMGVLTYEQMQELEPARELATLPGLKRKR